MNYAINHIATPTLTLDAFFGMARRLGVTDVEIRNDLPNMVDTALVMCSRNDGTPIASEVHALADPAATLRDSMGFVVQELRGATALA